MHRRTVLSGLAVGSGSLLAGCLGGADELLDRDGPLDRGELPGQDGDGSDAPAVGGPSSGDCGPAADPLADLLTDDPGDGAACPPDPEPSLAVENVRMETVEVTVTLAAPAGRDEMEDGEGGDGGSEDEMEDGEGGSEAGDGGGGDETEGGDAEDGGEDEAGDGDNDRFEETYTLDAGERVVEAGGVPAVDGLEVTVVLAFDPEGGTDEGENAAREWTATWDAASCKRHGIVLDPEGIEVGYVDPLSGPVDAQHDCYAGDEAPIRVVSQGRSRAVTVTVADRCSGERREETVEVGGDDAATLDDLLENGGIYDVTVDPADGYAETDAFVEACWGIEADIDADGSTSTRRLAID